MKSKVLKTILVATTISISSVSFAHAEAYFEVTLLHHDNKETFVIKLEDQAKIEHARKFVKGIHDVKRNIIGTIVKSKASYNPQWSFHLEPSTIKFVELCAEQIESTAAYMEDHLARTGETGTIKDMWCPYPCKVTREISFNDADEQL